MRELTEQQAAFVAAYVAGGGNATEAVKAAGYSQTSARQIGSTLLGKPHVAEAIRREQQRVIESELASKAVGVLRQLINDETASHKVRLDTAKTILDRAGHIAPKAEDRAKSEEDPKDDWRKYSTGELQAILDHIRAKNAAQEAQQSEPASEGASGLH